GGGPHRRVGRPRGASAPGLRTVGVRRRSRPSRAPPPACPRARLHGRGRDGGSGPRHGGEGGPGASRARARRGDPPPPPPADGARPPGRRPMGRGRRPPSGGGGHAPGDPVTAPPVHRLGALPPP